MPGPLKGNKRSKIVVLNLSSDVLAQWPSTDSSTPDADGKRSENTTPSIHHTDNALDDRSEATPQRADDTAQQDDKKKKANPTGRKRAPPAIDPEGPNRERGRPGPKKKAKLTDGTVSRDDSAKPAAATNAQTTSAAHKLGPRANTGAINAGLRALDRTGKPCRRWERKGLQLKSFTGTTWNMSSWKGHHRSGLNADGEVQSDSSSDVKPDNSALASEKSANGDMIDIRVDNGIHSSPAPGIAVL